MVEPTQNVLPKIAIVGGGLAGIAACVALADCGLQVDLYEANQRLGGRVGSFTDSQTGESFDYCQHVGMACCTNLVDLIEKLQQTNDWQREETLHFFAADGKHLPLKAAPLPAPLHLAGLLWRWPGLSIQDRISIASTLVKLFRMQDHESALDHFALEWLQQHQSPNAIAKFWQTILVSALGESIDRVALRPARKVLLDGFAGNREAYQLLVPKRPLSELFDARVRTWLACAKNVQVKLGAKVEGVKSSEISPTRIQLSDGSGLDYDAAILCVPWHRISRLLTLDSQEDPGNLETSPITGIHTWWDRAWLTKPHAILVDHLCQWVFAKHPGTSDCHEALDARHVASEPVYYQIVISSSRQFNLKERVEVESALRSDLQNIFPAIQQSTLVKCKVVTDPRSVFSVTPSSQQYRWPLDRYASQKIWLAGDWTNTGWPATMEGAIRSGYQAANDVAMRFGIKLGLPVADLRHGMLIRSMLRRSKSTLVR